MASTVGSGARGEAEASGWSETVQTATTPADEDVHYTLVHPLDAPLASFNNHSGIKVPISERVPRLGDWAQASGRDEGQHPDDLVSPVYASNGENSFAGPHATITTVNPFHRLSHPTSPGHDGVLPLPFAANHPTSADGSVTNSHARAQPGSDGYAALASGQQLLAPVHVTRVTSDTVVLVPAVNEEGQSIQPSNGILGRIGGRFRRKGGSGGPSDLALSATPAGRQDPNYSRPLHGEGRLNGAMSVGQAPPSPPTSEDEPESPAGHTSDELQHSQRQAGTELPEAAAEVALGPPILDTARRHSFTAEPETLSDREEDERPEPVAKTFDDQPVQRQGSAQSEVGSLYNTQPPPLPAGPTRTGSLAALNLRKKPSLETGLATPRATTRRRLSGHTAGSHATVPEDEAQLESEQEDSLHAGRSTGFPTDGSTATGVPHAIKPIRRNTTGAASVSDSSIMVQRSPLLQSQSQMEVPMLQGGSALVATRSKTSVPGIDGAALDSDILAEADKLRRERLSRRQKQRQDSLADEGLGVGEVRGRRRSSTAVGRSEAGPSALPGNTLLEASPDTAAAIAAGKDAGLPGNVEPERVLVGNLIGEDHVNYVLMYNMLTGIRIGVSRCQAKIKRPITEEDYTARHKFSFDIVGNELTPSARYDFKFKDYAPWIFRELRDESFHLDPADYLLSLTAKYILSELGSPGKSGSFFYFSRDYRFIIKTIHHSEHKFLRSILKDYHDHVKANPHTLLSRFYGLHRVKLPRGRKIHFVIMNNLFPPHRDIHETYDLKGSAYGREYPEDKAKENPKATLKDLNWVHRGRAFELGPEKRALFSEQLRRDMEFLKRIKVMDYSLLIGLHNMQRGNRDNIRENQLTIFHPDVNGLVRRKPSSVKAGPDASAVRKAVRRSDPKALVSATDQLPSSDSADRRHFLFYQDEGGLRATDEANQPLDLIYYLGVIDILTPYNTSKRLEHFWKGMTEDLHMISCVPPGEYGDRFLNFLLSFMRGADTSIRPKME